MLSSQAKVNWIQPKHTSRMPLRVNGKVGVSANHSESTIHSEASVQTILEDQSRRACAELRT